MHEVANTKSMAIINLEKMTGMWKFFSIYFSQDSHKCLLATFQIEQVYRVSCNIITIKNLYRNMQNFRKEFFKLQF